MRLNLGACDRAVDGFLSVDICPPADVVTDLSEPWPWEESSVDEVLAFDLIEHIGHCDHVGESACTRCAAFWKRALGWLFEGKRQRHPDGRIHVMNELYRALKPGARARIEVPNAAKGAGFYQDPTHKTPWCMNSFQYFQDGSFAHRRLAKLYGITARFKIVELGEREYQDAHEKVWKITAVLEAVK